MGNAAALRVGLLPVNNHIEMNGKSNSRGCIIIKVPPLASHHGHILTLLLLNISADRTWDLLADRVSHLNGSECENRALNSYQR